MSLEQLHQSLFNRQSASFYKFLLKIYPHQSFYNTVHFQNWYSNCDYAYLHGYYSFVFYYLNIFSPSSLTLVNSLSSPESLSSIQYLSLPLTLFNPEKGGKRRNQPNLTPFLFFSITLSSSLQPINPSTYHSNPTPSNHYHHHKITIHNNPTTNSKENQIHPYTDTQ